MLQLTTPVTSITPLAAKYRASLERLGIITVRDLLWHLPVRYEDFSKKISIDDVEAGENAIIVARVVSIMSRVGWKSRKNIVEATIEDDTGEMKAMWFNQRYLTKVLHQGATFYFSGKVVDSSGLTLSNPAYERYEKTSEALHFGNLTPIYPSTQRLTQKLLRFFMAATFKKEPNILEHLNDSYLKKEDMITLSEAVREIHFPKSTRSQRKAVYRLKFEELWQVQKRSLEFRKKLSKLPSFAIKEQTSSLDKWFESLPFSLTQGQKAAFSEISHDIEKSHPMIRLLQGDVGSGKTVVAAAALYLSTLSNIQGAIMAPTEVLAKQHFLTFKKLFNNFDVTICLMTRTSKLVSCRGEASHSNRDSIKKGMRGGTIDIIIGTHTLIYGKDTFKNLGLVIIDEQQRFGVKQRLEILKKNKDKTIPHMLSLTATPIPRTYTHYLYGALDVSILDELPHGRKKIQTKLIKRSKVEVVYEVMQKEIKDGRQAYVICPVIMESDSLGVEAVITEEEKLKQVFPKFNISLLHGKMSGPVKEKVMQDFVDRKIDILISTAVVEVGIDVPNATVMMIESPERFGLAQLHQFRGRVGREKHQSYCFIVADDEKAESNKRLSLFEKIDNGFELSEKDLGFRGPGELYGFSQSGFSQFKIATLKDIAIMKKVKMVTNRRKFSKEKEN